MGHIKCNNNSSIFSFERSQPMKNTHSVMTHVETNHPTSFLDGGDHTEHSSFVLNIAPWIGPPGETIALMILPLPCSHSLMSHTQCHINLDHNHYRQHNDNMFLECDVCGFFKSTNPLHEPTTTTPTQNSYLKVGDAFGMLNFTSVESSSMSTELASK